MASVMSILSKVITCFVLFFKLLCHTIIISPALDLSNSYFTVYSLYCCVIFIQCKVDKLVFIDVAESSTKGGSTDLEIFSLPKVEVSRGTSHCTIK